MKLNTQIFCRIFPSLSFPGLCLSFCCGTDDEKERKKLNAETNLHSTFFCSSSTTPPFLPPPHLLYQSRSYSFSFTEIWSPALFSSSSFSCGTRSDRPKRPFVQSQTLNFNCICVHYYISGGGGDETTRAQTTVSSVSIQISLDDRLASSIAVGGRCHT